MPSALAPRTRVRSHGDGLSAAPSSEAEGERDRGSEGGRQPSRAGQSTRDSLLLTLTHPLVPSPTVIVPSFTCARLLRASRRSCAFGATRSTCARARLRHADIRPHPPLRVVYPHPHGPSQRCVPPLSEGCAPSPTVSRCALPSASASRVPRTQMFYQQMLGMGHVRCRRHTATPPPLPPPPLPPPPAPPPQQQHSHQHRHRRAHPCQATLCTRAPAFSSFDPPPPTTPLASHPPPTHTSASAGGDRRPDRHDAARHHRAARPHLALRVDGRAAAPHARLPGTPRPRVAHAWWRVLGLSLCVALSHRDGASWLRLGSEPQAHLQTAPMPS